MAFRFTDNLSIRQFRRRLAQADALPQLSLLGLAAGLVSGIVIVIFRFALEFPLALLLPGGDGENFESLEIHVRFALVVGGALVLGLLLQRLPENRRSVGIAHVMERLSRHQGHLPAANAGTQFLAGILALASGQSAGREGPAVHLGAAASSLIGQRLRLPNNSIRTLVGCGAAAAIAASFNTPLAAVIFALEVVMMEYSITSFIPVVIASVSGALVSFSVYGPEPAFSVPEMHWTSLWEVPFFVGEGLLIGAAAALFIFIARSTSRVGHWPIWARITLAGGLTGAAALIAPEVMGIGYDSVNLALVGGLGLLTLMLVAVLKLLVTAAGFGLGVPAGVIGPCMVIGAMLGGTIGTLGAALWPEYASVPGVYVVIGMSAMLAAVIQAPLAALMAVFELTGNPNLIVPAMLAIVIASLTTSQLFATKSIFVTVLEARGLTLRSDPVTLALQRAAVASIMERSLLRQPRRLTLEDAREALERKPIWVVVDDEQGPVCILAAADLARHVEQLDASADQTVRQLELRTDEDVTAIPNPDAMIDLLALPGLRKDVTLVNLQATLHQALDELDASGKEALCVTRAAAPGITRVVGVLTRDDIEKYYGFRG